MGPIVKNLSKSKTKCSLYFEEKNSMVDLTLTSCDNHITATAKGVEGVQITKYEYQIDEGDWFTGSETQEFNDQTVGNHTIKLRVTNDNSEVSKEVKRSIIINEQRKVEIAGKQIPIATCNNGLYEVSHDVSEISTDWNRTEYRFAGVNYKNDTTAYVHNYVRFNNEIWRIIGLVNVKTESGIEQRLKIVRTNDINGQKDFGYFSFDIDKDFAEYTYYNIWSEAFLKNMLNGIYYESGIGECYTGSGDKTATKSTCDFTGNGEQPKGLDEIAKKMIDNNVIWNIGTNANDNNSINVEQFYEKERGTSTYFFDIYPTEWSRETDVGDKYNGIGLIYPSDYGYSTNGGSTGRKNCFDKDLVYFDEDKECVQKNWLKTSSRKEQAGIYTITPYFQLGSKGQPNIYAIYYNSMDSAYCMTNNIVYPTVYLTPSTTITSGDGTINNPYTLS